MTTVGNHDLKRLPVGHNLSQSATSKCSGLTRHVAIVDRYMK